MFSKKNHNSICKRLDGIIEESESLRLSRYTGYPRGCVVQLASGGPAMTVERVLQHPVTNQEYARCLWFQDGRYIAAELLLEVLIRIDPFTPGREKAEDKRNVCATIAPERRAQP